MTDPACHPMVGALLERCPFIAGHLDPACHDLPTVAFGDAATALKNGALNAIEEDQLFDYFNDLAATGDEQALDILGTGAIEGFNDDPVSQRLARAKLKGRGLKMLEEFRVGWGQPVYGDSA